MTQKAEIKEPLTLECGTTLPGITIQYHTFGTLSEAKDNVIWVCHALTANSDVADWWPHTVEPSKFLDPERWFIVCANVLGSPYGSTSPVTENPATGEKWRHNFPPVSVRDMVEAHKRLARHLGIDRVQLIMGASIGGFQALEWAVQEPEKFASAAFIATSPRATPWICAFNESQRWAIELDPTWKDSTDDAGSEGMAAARSIAMLSYRGPAAYDETQEETDDPHNAGMKRRVQSYQRYQGKKLRKRFDAICYHRLTQSIDSHNLERGRGSMAEVLGRLSMPCLVVDISSDVLFPPHDFPAWVELIPDVEFHTIDSPFGHDGFLVEHKKLDHIIQNFQKRTR